MSRRVVVVTGASSGIGEHAALALAAQGAHVVVVGRNEERTHDVARRAGGDALTADFDALEEVHGLAAAVRERYDRLDVLVNNAGGITGRRGVSADGHELTLQRNHLAPFLLTNLLAPLLIATAQDSPARVVSTASYANVFGRVRLDDLEWRRRPWLGGWGAYGTAKLETILFVRELAERLTGTGVAAYSFHPGFVSTRFGSEQAAMRVVQTVTGGHYGIPASEGAVPMIRLAAEAPVGAPSGTYFDRLQANGRVSPQARDAQLGRDLWAATATAVGYEDDALRR